MAMFPIYSVIVERSNNEKITVEVPEYEIPVLKVVHGEFNVFEGGVLFEDWRPDEASEILEGLKKKYNNPNVGDVVMQVYRNTDELAKAAGIKAGKAKKKAESEQLDMRGARDAAAKQAELKQTEVKAQEAIDTATGDLAQAKSELADAQAADKAADTKAK